MAQDLRSYLKDVDHLLTRVHKEVDPHANIGELCFQSPGPILFDNVKGYPGWRIADILLKTRETQAIALGCTPDKVVTTLGTMLDRELVPTVMVDAASAPCKEIIQIGEQADLTRLPVVIHSSQDGGPYIGSGINITKDLDTGVRNLACLRMQIKGPRKTGVLMVPRHTWRQYETYDARDVKMPMAVAIGVHPMLEIATNYCTTYGVDEFEVAGAMLGEPVRMVKCETIDMEVPAESEIVIEGYILPKVRELEGPFGEFQGYVGVGDGMNQVFEVTAITMRHDAIFRHLQATNISDHHALVALPMEARLLRQLRDVEGFADVHDVHVPYWGGCFLTVIKMTPHFEGQVKDVLLGAMSSSYLHPKVIVAVDDDVDIYDPRDVLWSIACRVNPAVDLVVVEGTRNHPLDASVPEIVPPGGRWQRVGGKLGIDACKPSTTFPDRRKTMERAEPMGRGKVNLKDFAS